MSNSAPPPRLPLWLFVLADVLLVATAALVAARSRQPFTPGVTLAIVACVALGTLALLVPLVLRHERLKNEQLDERQRALEALARTLTAAAEQVSIATAGLNDVGDLVQKNLRQADHLPHRLQEKIAEFQAQLANAADAEKEELEQELEALRTSESERLETIATQIAKATAEWARLEAATRQQLAAAQEALARIGPAAEQALASARTEAGRLIGETAGSSLRDLAQARAAALADLEARLATAGDTLVRRLGQDLEERIAAFRSASAAPTAALMPAAAPAPEAVPVSATADAAEPPAPTGESSESSPSAEAPAAPPKRARRPRREEPAPAASEASPVEPVAPETGAALPQTPPEPEAAAPEPAAVVPDTGPASAPEPAPVPATTPEPEPSPAAAEEPELPRRKALRRPPSEPALELGIDDSAPAGAVSERVLSSDGATRLIATAYIGIGNRLFLRGEGPGLSWDKGVPLQFVSIGKWRWETNEATAPVQFRLYKNDEVECSALGTVAIEPGHQQEVMANF